ncbi:probable serine/threonine-protein kinase WNK9 isoform X2 [Hevea brasiliensis]|uniref:probable serine/threonine-protein kinase WNK9 isoform X2 n=1 Tax=Hevea brasiliensis TaxID=3981 RepID=UPI0025D9AB0E|nr:probable serine/threonine-protein kinase WNK9 isoform X2 [Hevea brasiliensis]XP_057993229.1 probable serine/threonine-protein kinase WNK9 isoform X2 [Hevea brasiliensis]
MTLLRLILLGDMEDTMKFLAKELQRHYKAFDEYEGIEVAWNQVKLYDFLQRPEDLERLYCEIHLLKTLKHENIMKFYTSWVDAANRNINFVTEMFTSGTLRQYRLKHKRVNIRAVKYWCKQILKGLLYLHSHNPPVIHRDLKCDNIFVNGNQGEVKIGDLGLAAILKKSYAACCVGTPEFMAPEVYEEEYNELVDIYSFGMCVLEMVTFEYPYSECSHPAQIYKKVISGKKPDALYKVKDPEVRQFVEKCLATASSRLSARELLEDPFLQIDDYGYDLTSLDYQGDCNEIGALVRQPFYGINHTSNSLTNGYAHYLCYGPENEIEYHKVEYEPTEIDLLFCQEDEHFENVDITIKGRRREDDGIFLRLRIADEEGCIRNIYFPFDIETDTALSVAAEMISELDITDQDVLKIADMIDGEIASLVPEWRRGQEKEESLQCANATFCQNCASYGYLLDYLSSNSPGAKNLQVLQCSKHGSANLHGRFEEITYQIEGPEKCPSTDCAPFGSSQSNGISYTDIWAQRDAPELSSQGLREIHCDDEGNDAVDQSIFEKEERIINMESFSESNTTNCVSSSVSAACAHWDDYENEIRQELRWLKAKYQMQLRELRDQQLRVKSKPSSPDPNSDNKDHNMDNGVHLPSILTKVKREEYKPSLKSLPSGKHLNSTFLTDAEKRCANLEYQVVQNFEAINRGYSPEQMVTAKSFYTGDLLPYPLHRATSLPVDALDV